MKDLRTYIKEDSLDDFDIDKKHEKARAKVSSNVKNDINKKITNNIETLYKICDEFFKSKDLNINRSEHHNGNTYCIYKPTLSFAFEYKPTDTIHFDIYVGGYGSIKGVEKENIEEFMKELGDEICSKLDYMKYNKSYGINKTSLNSIYNASWKLGLETTVKDIK